MVEYIIIVFVIFGIVVYTIRHNEKERRKHNLSDEEISICEKAYQEESKARNHYYELSEGIEFNYSHDAERYRNWVRYCSSEVDATYDCAVITVGFTEAYILYWLLFNYIPSSNGNLIISGLIVCGAIAILGGLFGGLFGQLVNKLYKTKRKDLKYWLICVGCSFLAVLAILVMKQYNSDSIY